MVLFLEQWKKPENRPAGVIGVFAAAVSVVIFGGDNMVLPAMALIVSALLLGRDKLCR